MSGSGQGRCEGGENKHVNLVPEYIVCSSRVTAREVKPSSQILEFYFV